MLARLHEASHRQFLLLRAISAWKSGPKTAKKPRPDRDQTTWDRKFVGTGKDRNRGPVFGPSQILNFEDREKTGLNRSQLVFTAAKGINDKVIISAHFN